MTGVIAHEIEARRIDLQFAHDRREPEHLTTGGGTLLRDVPVIRVDTDPGRLNDFLNANAGYTPNGWLYNVVYFTLVVIFTFFYSGIVLNTRDVADNLKKTGAFIPGIRPGQPTVDYLNKILYRITTAGRKQLRAELAQWQDYSRVMTAVLDAAKP